MSKQSTSSKVVLDKGDFTKVKDAAGEVQEHPVPKAWVGTDLLPQGWKATSATESASEEQSPDVAHLEARITELEAENTDLRKQVESTDDVEQPAGNASTEVWAAWAVEHRGATEDDVKGLSRDDLREKYGTPAAG